MNVNFGNDSGNFNGSIQDSNGNPHITGNVRSPGKPNNFSFASAPPSSGSLPPYIPQKPDPTRKDVVAPLGNNNHGLFRWDPVKGDFVLIGIKAGANGKVNYLPEDQYKLYNANVLNGPANAAIPEKHPSWPSGGIVVTDKVGGDGPIWMLTKDNRMVQIGSRTNGVYTYFKPSSYKIIETYNTTNKVIYAPDGQVSEPPPPAADPEHPEFYVPPESKNPTGPEGRLYRYDTKLKTYVMVGPVKNGTVTPLSGAALTEANRDAYNPAPIPDRHPDVKRDWIETETSGGDGPIYRFTAEGKVIQIGVKQNGKEIYFNKETVNLLATQNPKGGPQPTKETYEMLKARNITELSGPPPAEESPEYKDEDVKLGDGTMGVMRWEPNVKRYVLIGTRDAAGTITPFSTEDYHKYNNGPVSLYSREDSPQNQDKPIDGVIWRFDPKLGRSIQVGWVDKAGKPRYFSEVSGDNTAFRSDETQSAIDAYNRQNKKDGAPIIQSTDDDRITELLKQYPTSGSNLKHPDIARRSTNSADPTVYVWRWHAGLDRYVVIGVDGSPNPHGDFKNPDFVAFYNRANSGPGYLRVTPDDKPPADVVYVPQTEHPDHKDQAKTKDGWHWKYKFVYRWDAVRGDYVEIGYYIEKDSDDRNQYVHTKSNPYYYSEKEFLENNPKKES